MNFCTEKVKCNDDEPGSQYVKLDVEKLLGPWLDDDFIGI